MLAPWKKSYDQPRQHIKKQRHYFANKGPSSQGDGFFSSEVWMWELDHKESWALKSWCFWTVVLEKTLESPLDCKEIKAVSPKGNQSWIFIGELILKLKLQYFGHLMRRADSLESTLMLGKTEDRRRKWSEVTQSSPTLCSPMDCSLPGSSVHGIFQERVLEWGAIDFALSSVVAQSCLTLCDPMNCSMPGFPVLHYLSKFVQTHVHWVNDIIQPSHPLLPSSPAFNLSHHQGLFQWVSSSH